LRQAVRVSLSIVLVVLVTIWLIVIAVVRLGPGVRHGRMVVLDRPKPCSMHQAQHALDRLVRAGFDAEIVEHADQMMTMWANARVAGETKRKERYVIQVPRRQAKAANLV
jgi:hypothetical protein